MRTQHDNKEVRSITRATSHIEVRKTAKGRTAIGYSIVFPPASSQDLGGFVEQIDSNAVNIAGNSVWALFGHDTNRILGSTDSGTLRLAKDRRGLRHEIDLPNTTDGNDLAELLARGDGGQCSFGFVALADNWTQKNGVILRTVTDLELLEISVGVIFPAYNDTKSALRSAPAAIRAKLLKRDADADVCGCDCASCLDGDCDECLDPECDEECCSACPMQEDRKRADSVRVRRLYASLRK